MYDVLLVFDGHVVFVDLYVIIISNLNLPKVRKVQVIICVPIYRVVTPLRRRLPTDFLNLCIQEVVEER